MFNRLSAIQTQAVSFHFPRARKQAVIIFLLAILTACATQHAATLKVNPRHQEGNSYAPQELTSMMSILGYQQLRIKDPVTGQSVRVAEKHGEYRLLFQSLEDNNIQVDIHIVKTDGRITLYFYNINHSALDTSSLHSYERLRQRLEFEYGAKNVSGSHP